MQIKTVENKKEVSEFIDLPWKIYKNYPHWVPPLKKEVEEMLDRKRNPFFMHSEASYFIVKEGGETLGRIAAILNNNHNSFHNEKVGFFGFFETIEDYRVAELLLNKARAWCREKGLTALRGPTSFSTNDECGLLIEGFDRDPAIMMPYNPPYYVEYIEKYGLRKAKDIFAWVYIVAEDNPSERLLKLLEKIKRKRNIIIRSIDMRRYNREVKIIKEIYNSAWKKNWGFVPMTEEEMDLLAKKLKPIADPEFVYFAEVNGVPAAVCLALPDYNQVLKKLNGALNLPGIIKFMWHKRKINFIRLMAFGVKKEYRNQGIEIPMYYEFLLKGRKRGFYGGELSWTLEDNDAINNGIKAMNAKIYKKYRIYEMNL